VTIKDHRGDAISGATASARDAFERALDLHLSWRTGADVHLEHAAREAPVFTMAHVLAAYLNLCSRDVARVREARAAYERAAALPANSRERLHVAAIRAALDDDFLTFSALIRGLLEQYPRDVLALQVGHALDYMTGDLDAMASRITAVLPAWAPDLPGYHAVLAMQSFSLVEAARYDLAAEYGLRALELKPLDARAHHALAHVYEMTSDASGGVRWMQDRLAHWSVDTVAATHLWWHLALFHLARDDTGAALALYDQRVRAGRSRELADLIDAASLLWRFELLDVDTSGRWLELSAAWAPHVDDAYCTFSDLHAMLAHVGARDWSSAGRLERALLERQASETRYGETTRLVGLPASRAIVAFGRGDYARATQLLGSIPAHARRIGGSHAQRDLLYLTLLYAVRRLRRPARPVAA